MWLRSIQRYLLPGSIEKDPGFRKEVDRLSHIGLHVLAGAEIVVSLFMHAAFVLVRPDPEEFPLRLWMSSTVVVIGVVTLLLSRVGKLRTYSRLIGSVSALASAGVVIWMQLMASQYDPTALQVIPGQITLVTLVTVAAIPLRPTDTLVFGFLMETIYVILAVIALEVRNVGTGVDPLFVLFNFMLTCLSAGLAAVVYYQRRSSYEWNLSTVEAAENLRQAEARNLLSQNAASVGRLAAALSHELNSPVGALVSGVETLLLLTSRQATSPIEDQPRLVVMQNELRKSISESTNRLRDIVARMQRFTNLDKAEVQSANINDILTDVTALVEPKYQKAKIVLSLEQVPPLVCRPQQLSAVFSNLLGNAIEATEGKGVVSIHTRVNGANIEIEITDDGRGLETKALETIFDPGFKVANGRVSTGNWSMFSSRQIIREHGGDIHIQSELGRGTRVLVVLPAEDESSRLT